MSIRTKFLVLCIVLVLTITTGISATYYIITRQDKQRESQQRVQIAFDIILNDFTKRVNTYTASVRRFLNENITLMWATYAYSLDDSEHGTIRFLFDHFHDVAAELRQFGRVALADRVMLYGANKRLLVVYQRVDEQETLGGYLVSKREGPRYLPMDDLSIQAELTFRRNNLAIDAINKPFPDMPLPSGVEAEYDDAIPAGITTTIFREGRRLGIKMIAPIFRREAVIGLLVGEVFYTPDMVAEYAALSQTAVNLFSGNSWSIGTLPHQLSLSPPFVQHAVDCQDLASHELPLELSTITLDQQDYYQGRCVFSNAQGMVGAIAVSLSKTIEHREIGKLFQAVFTTSVVGILICVALVFGIFAPTFTGPIITLTNAALRMAQGDLQQAIDTSGHDELGSLAQSFVYMRDQVQQKIAELQHLNAELDQRVEARTAEVVRQQYILDTFMATVPDQIYFKDRDSRITRANQAHSRHMGFPDPAQEIGKTDFDLFPEVEARQRYEQEQDIIRTGTSLIDREECLQLPDGRVEWVLTTKMPLRNEHHDIIGIFGISRNITTLKQTEDALRVAKEGAEEAQKVAEQAQRAAEAANRSKSEFLANMSHELRTPLNVILGLAQLMVQNAGVSGEERENFEIIQHSGEHLLNLINNVLDLSKIEAGRMALQETNIDLYATLDDIEKMFAYKAAQQALYLTIDREEHLPRYVKLDSGKLRQILINLLNNAVKFTEQGGITVKIHHSATDTPSIVTLHLSVSDTGPGIPPEEQASVFDAFTQTSSGRQTQEGTGLGLAICQRFVALMGGTISISSEIGTGTTFTCTVRAAVIQKTALPPSHVRAQSRVVALVPGQRRYRMLVVDDKPNNRRVLVKLLAPLGFEAQEAANGQEALAVWATFKPDLIWMDLRMPVMDGYEATRRIKASLEGRATVIIAITASSSDEERDLVLEAGCDDLVCKPFRTTDLFDLMHKYLGVEFVYDNGEAGWAQPGQEAPEQVLTPAVLHTLPDDLADQLRYAIQVTDPGRVQHLLGPIREQNQALADVLAKLVKDFRFDILQRMI